MFLISPLSLFACEIVSLFREGAQNLKSHIVPVPLVTPRTVVVPVRVCTPTEGEEFLPVIRGVVEFVDDVNLALVEGQRQPRREGGIFDHKALLHDDRAVLRQVQVELVALVKVARRAIERHRRPRPGARADAEAVRPDAAFLGRVRLIHGTDEDAVIDEQFFARLISRITQRGQMMKVQIWAITG